MGRCLLGIELETWAGQSRLRSDQHYGPSLIGDSWGLHGTVARVRAGDGKASTG